MEPRSWEAFLAARLGRPVRVDFSRARSMPLEVVEDRQGVLVRMHGFFESAPEEVGEAMAGWIRSGRRARRACALLDGWIDARLAELPAARLRDALLRPRGEVYDLDALAEPLFGTEFAHDFSNGLARPGITWGRRGRSQARRSLHLGSYAAERNVVRVHRALDQPAVPGWFVRFVLFHEVLHAALPGHNHGSLFRSRERAYPDYRRARRWERDHIAALIRSARTGKPMRRSRAHRLAQGLLFRL
ncbi:MAG: hypothetical protein ACYSX0_16480 [Planctomycetota bacterium]